MGSLELRVFPAEPVGEEDLSQKVSGSGESGGLGGLYAMGLGGLLSTPLEKNTLSFSCISTPKPCPGGKGEPGAD